MCIISCDHDVSSDKSRYIFSFQFACNQLCGWKGIEMVCGGEHKLDSNAKENNKNKYGVPAISLYCNKHRLDHPQYNDETTTHAIVKSRTLQLHQLYDNEK